MDPLESADEGDLSDDLPVSEPDSGSELSPSLRELGSREAAHGSIEGMQWRKEGWG